jgi:hypothetical protein
MTYARVSGKGQDGPLADVGQVGVCECGFVGRRRQIGVPAIYG